MVLLRRKVLLCMGQGFVLIGMGIREWFSAADKDRGVLSDVIYVSHEDRVWTIRENMVVERNVM
jgi:hypothetical protein